MGASNFVGSDFAGSTGGCPNEKGGFATSVVGAEGVVRPAPKLNGVAALSLIGSISFTTVFGGSEGKGDNDSASLGLLNMKGGGTAADD